MKASVSEFISVRGLRYHIRQWGEPGMPKLFMVHGWMDVAASFQFMIDHLQRDWHVIAPDWRGFGLTQRPAADSYWIPDYLGDLDAILRHYQPDGQIDLIGHSMGGLVSSMYAGTRPQRLRKLVNLEGFGLPSSTPDQAPTRAERWLDELLTPQSMPVFADVGGVARRLQKTNPRLSDERAAFLAQHWAAPNDQGNWEILGDPAHKRVNPILYRNDEAEAFWKRIAVPSLFVEARDSKLWHWLDQPELVRAEISKRLGWLSNCQYAMLEDAGHMMHHDQPEQLAAMIEAFLAE